MTFQDIAEYTPQEIARLQLGWLIRERDDYQSGGRSGADSQRRKVRRGQQRARDEMYTDLGIQ